MILEPKSAAPVAATSDALTDDQLGDVIGGAPAKSGTSSKDEGPEEHITFVYGGLVISYTPQQP